MFHRVIQKIFNEEIDIAINNVNKLKALPITTIKSFTKSEIDALKANNIITIAQFAENWAYIPYLAKTTGINEALLEKICAACRLLLRAGDLNESDYAKIVLAGLDQSGKSSIISILKHQKPLLEIHRDIQTLSPTTGLIRVQIDLGGLIVVLWELGGQIGYRSEYLREPEKYFLDSHAFIFVIDLQSKERFEESLDYLRSLVELLLFIGLELPIQILLHKADPNRDLSEYQIELEQKIHEIIEKTGWKAPKDINLTTIFEPGSISAAFTNILSKILPITAWIEDALANIAIAQKSPFVSIMDVDTLVVYGVFSAFNPHKVDTLKQSLANWLLLYDNRKVDSFFMLFEDQKLDEKPVWVGLIDVTINGKKFIYAAVFTDKIGAVTNLDREKLSELLQENVGTELDFLKVAMVSVPKTLTRKEV